MTSSLIVLPLKLLGVQVVIIYLCGDFHMSRILTEPDKACVWQNLVISGSASLMKSLLPRMEGVTVCVY